MASASVEKGLLTKCRMALAVGQLTPYNTINRCIRFSSASTAKAALVIISTSVGWLYFSIRSGGQRMGDFHFTIEINSFCVNLSLQLWMAVSCFESQQSAFSLLSGGSVCSIFNFERIFLWQLANFWIWSKLSNSGGIFICSGPYWQSVGLLIFSRFLLYWWLILLKR